MLSKLASVVDLLLEEREERSIFQALKTNPLYQSKQQNIFLALSLGRDRPPPSALQIVT